MMIGGRPIPSPTPIAILSVPERPLLVDEVDDGSGVVDGGVELIVVGDGADDEIAEDDELEFPAPKTHSYLIPFATLLGVCTSTHCSVPLGVTALFKSS